MSKYKFDANLHRTLMIKILKKIYQNPLLQTNLGFKGGTALYLFYKLPRFSTDLDFDLIKNSNAAHSQLNQPQTIIIQQLKQIVEEFNLKPNFSNKKNTLFFLLNYQQGAKNIKIEISKRKTNAQFEIKNFLGIPMLVMTKTDMAACKLATLLTRKKFASRDVFDLWFMLEQGWPINEITLKEKTNFSLKQALKLTTQKITAIKQKQLLQGLGELLDEKTKFFVKEKLIDELAFLLKLLQTKNFAH